MIYEFLTKDLLIKNPPQKLKNSKLSLWSLGEGNKVHLDKDKYLPHFELEEQSASARFKPCWRAKMSLNFINISEVDELAWIE